MDFMAQQNMDGQMQKKYFRRIAFSIMLGGAALIGTSASAATLQDIFQLSAEGQRVAQASQERVDALTSTTQGMLGDYRAELKTIEDLRAYNIQKEREITDQKRQISTLQSSIERATLIDRQILPLMNRMIDVLERFVRSDVPFRLDERLEEVAKLKDIMDMSDVPASEKFRRVFEAYQLENDAGRAVETYTGTITLNGETLTGDVLQIGRIGLYFITGDKSNAGIWNKTTGQWEELDSGDYRAVSLGIKIAANQIPPDLVRLPIVATE